MGRTRLRNFAFASTIIKIHGNRQPERLANPDDDYVLPDKEGQQVHKILQQCQKENWNTDSMEPSSPHDRGSGTRLEQSQI